MKLLAALYVLWSLLGATRAQAVVVKKTLAVDPSVQQQLIANGDLEAVDGGGFAGWRGWNLGYTVDDQVRHSGQFSARCENATTREHRGMTYIVRLNQQVATPIVAECWSKAENVSGSPNSDYSLYLDLEYMDGTPLWGQISAFKTGTHDWQRRTVTVVPAKPVRTVSVHGIFRLHAGTAWFDDFKLWELILPEGVKQFDAVPITGGGTPPSYEDPFGILPHAFYLRDVAANSDFVQPSVVSEPTPGTHVLAAESLGLTLRVTRRRLAPDALRIDLALSDTTGKDRAVTVYCSVPVSAVGWRWHDDQRTSREIKAGDQYNNYVWLGAGANGLASRYPLACISGEAQALVIGAPLDVPRLYRFAYDAGAGELYAAVDLGLAPDTRKHPSAADCSFVLYRCDPQWGFRAALQRYYELFPACFTKRNQKEGIWMPFVDIGTVAGWEDFGFQFQEGAPNVAFDEEHGIYSFPYVEPMTHWLRMPQEMERTGERAIALIKEQAAAGNRQSQATVNCVIEDAEGNWNGGPIVAPWCDGALYLLNPSPAVMADQPEAPTKFRNDLAALESWLSRPISALPGWNNWGRGYTAAPGQGRDGSTAIRLTRNAEEDNAGASQRIILNQDAPRPLVARVWTRAENVTAEPSNNYSMYLDLVYADGTPLYGQIATAAVGTHDWQLLEKTIVPAKPVQAVNFHLLLRAPHTGTVWFDDAFLAEEGSDSNLLRNPGCEPAATPGVVPEIDGQYIDSLEMGATTLNYRREHFTNSDTPLVFDREGRVCQMMIFNTLEFTKALAQRMHGLGKMMFANATPWNFPWAAASLDVMGTETNWAPGGTFSQEKGWTDGGPYRPEGDGIMNYRRALCYQRPYLLLQNTVFDLFKPEWVELYMKRCTAYAIFPSFFSHNAADDVYWNRPNLYDRDRPLFRKYIPIISTLNAAGWEPITYAHADKAKVYVERYGKAGGALYFTVFNDSAEAQGVTVTIDAEALGLSASAPEVRELLSHTVIPATVTDGKLALKLELAAEDVKVLRL